MSTKKIFFCIGLVIYFLGIYLGDYYWYSEEDKDFSGFTAALSVVILCGIGVAIMIWYLYELELDSFINLIGVSFGGVIMTLLFMGFYHDAIRERNIKENGKETFGIVNYRETGSLSSIKYSFRDMGERYDKSDKDTKNNRHISLANIQAGYLDYLLLGTRP